MASTPSDIREGLEKALLFVDESLFRLSQQREYIQSRLAQINIPCNVAYMYDDNPEDVFSGDAFINAWVEKYECGEVAYNLSPPSPRGAAKKIKHSLEAEFESAIDISDTICSPASITTDESVGSSTPTPLTPLKIVVPIVEDKPMMPPVRASTRMITQKQRDEAVATMRFAVSKHLPAIRNIYIEHKRNQFEKPFPFQRDEQGRCRITPLQRDRYNITKGVILWTSETELSRQKYIVSIYYYRFLPNLLQLPVGLIQFEDPRDCSLVSLKIQKLLESEISHLN